MKKVLILSLSIFLIPFVANATVTPTTKIVTTSYVQGAFDTMDGSKQEVLSSSGNSANVVTSGAGEFVTAVAAASGTVTVSTGDVSFPVGSGGASGRASMWIE